MTRYRDHRGSLADSLDTVQEFRTRAELIAYLREINPLFPPDFADRLKIEPYADDWRIGWHNTHIVTIEGVGVVGFIEDPL